jgi:hypothetical protein
MQLRLTSFVNFNAEMCCMLRVKNHHYEKMASTIVNRFPKGKRYIVFVALAEYLACISDSFLRISFSVQMCIIVSPVH